MDAVAELALKTYADTGITITPLFPAVLVRVLPPPTKSASGLILFAETTTQGNHNPVYEGIVLRPYPPKKTVYKGKEILLDSGLKVGDHICFPHWAGEPVKGLDDDRYRLVPAKGILSEVGRQDAGEILGIVSRVRSLDARDLADDAMLSLIKGPITSKQLTEWAYEFLKKYDVIDRLTEATLKK